MLSKFFESQTKAVSHRNINWHLQNMKKVFLKIRQIAIEFPDGVTIVLGKAERVESGWVVRRSGLTDFIGEEGMKKAIFEAADLTNYVSGWHDGENELWDVVDIFDNEDEATQAGIEENQMAIYQIETGRLKWLS